MNYTPILSKGKEKTAKLDNGCKIAKLTPEQLEKYKSLPSILGR